MGSAKEPIAAAFSVLMSLLVGRMAIVNYLHGVVIIYAGRAEYPRFEVHIADRPILFWILETFQILLTLFFVALPIALIVRARRKYGLGGETSPTQPSEADVS
jgi:hypothetical protein